VLQNLGLDSKKTKDGKCQKFYEKKEKDMKPHLPAARLPPVFRRQPGRQAGHREKNTLCALWLIFGKTVFRKRRIR